MLGEAIIASVNNTTSVAERLIGDAEETVEVIERGDYVVTK